ncbi:hypothetical protein GQ600_4159 [Phytophthora cactorum]|nr:hypothetical protein GQ600_4159 [Phytophthora cactorum]
MHAGKRTALKAVHNMIQDIKRTSRGGKTYTQRTLVVLDEFMESGHGNTSEYIVDSEKKTNVARVVTFQSASQKGLFAAFSEAVLVDSTDGTSVNRYKLFSFAVHNVFGRFSVWCSLSNGPIRAARASSNRRGGESKAGRRSFQEKQSRLIQNPSGHNRQDAPGESTIT